MCAMIAVGGQREARGTPLAAGEARSGRVPPAVQELVCPLLERGRRRGRVLIAGEAVEDVGGDRGPAGELGLERRHRGDGLWGGADPQEARLRILLDRWVEHVREERAQRMIPADDHRQAWLLCRETIATHRHLAGGWWWAVWRAGHAAHGVCIGRGCCARRRPWREVSATGRVQHPGGGYLPLPLQ